MKTRQLLLSLAVNGAPMVKARAPDDLCGAYELQIPVIDAGKRGSDAKYEDSQRLKCVCAKFEN